MSWGTDIIYVEEEKKKRSLMAILDWLEGGGVAKFLYRILGGLAS